MNKGNTEFFNPVFLKHKVRNLFDTVAQSHRDLLLTGSLKRRDRVKEKKEKRRSNG